MIVPWHQSWSEITGAEFYDYKDKYEDGAMLHIPSVLSESETAEVQGLAIKVFNILRCRGLARVDFFTMMKLKFGSLMKSIRCRGVHAYFNVPKTFGMLPACHTKI